MVLNFCVIFLFIGLEEVLAYPPIGIDLTHEFSNEYTIQWPTDVKFNLTQSYRGYVNRQDGSVKYWYESNRFSQTEHSGTHLDAPAHFSKGSWRTHEIPIHKLVGPAVVVDVTQQASTNVDYRLSVEDLELWEENHGKIPHAAVVIMRSGHWKHYYNRTKYLGYPDPQIPLNNPKDTENLHFPGIHPQAAKWLSEERNIVGVGVDTPSMDYGQSKEFATHQIFGAKNIWGLENLANLDDLEPTGFTIFAMVQKIKDGSGGPARVLALPSSLVVNIETSPGSNRQISTSLIFTFQILLFYIINVSL